MTTITTATILFVCETTIRLMLAVHIIMRRRPVPETLAWLLVLLFCPVVGPVSYLLLGEARIGERRARRYEELSKAIGTRAVELWKGRANWTQPDRAAAHIARLGTIISGLPPLQGNQIEIITSSEEYIKRLISDIDRAHQHCHLLYYLWMTTGAGIEVSEALIRAQGRGVKCRVLVDAVGGFEFLDSRLPGRMRAAGIEVASALGVNPLRMIFARLDLRNHRKLAVIDSRVAYTGSQNLNDSTFNHRGAGPWLDLSLRITGPAAQALQTVFLQDWQQEATQPLPPVDAFLPDEQLPGDTLVHVIPTGPGAVPDRIHDAYLAMLFNARHEIIVTSPYFVPDEATKAAFINAALRGVAVTIVVPQHLDTPIVAAASRSCYEELLEAGVVIKEHPHGLLHAKTAIIDSTLAVIGSANFDRRSFWLNFEITIFLYDERPACMLRAAQQERMDAARPIDLAEWRKRSAMRRFAENTAELFAPVL